LAKASGMAVASLILGICSIVLGWIPLLGWAIIITGFVLSLVTLKKLSKDKKLHGRGMAIAGLVMSSISLFFFVILIGIGGLAYFGVLSPEKFLPEKNVSAEANSTTQQQSSQNNQQADETIDLFYAGDKVEVGSFAYTINSYDVTDKIGQSVAGTFMGEKADGIFLVLDITIENVAKESKTFVGDNVKIIDDQNRLFEHDSIAELYLPDNQKLTLEQMQPGLPKRGKLVFDVPQDMRGLIEISSDDLFSMEKKYVSWNEK